MVNEQSLVNTRVIRACELWPHEEFKRDSLRAIQPSRLRDRADKSQDLLVPLAGLFISLHPKTSMIGRTQVTLGVTR